MAAAEATVRELTAAGLLTPAPDASGLPDIGPLWEAGWRTGIEQGHREAALRALPDRDALVTAILAARWPNGELVGGITKVTATLIADHLRAAEALQ